MFCLLVHVTSPSIRGGRLGRAGCGDTRIASSKIMVDALHLLTGNGIMVHEQMITKEIKELLSCGFEIKGY